MMDKVIGLFMALVFLAALSVIVSKRTQTAKVVSSILNGFSGAVKAATLPASYRA